MALILYNYYIACNSRDFRISTLQFDFYLFSYIRRYLSRLHNFRKCTHYAVGTCNSRCFGVLYNISLKIILDGLTCNSRYFGGLYNYIVIHISNPFACSSRYFSQKNYHQPYQIHTDYVFSNLLTTPTGKPVGFLLSSFACNRTPFADFGIQV